MLLPGAVLAAARFGTAAGFYYGTGVCTLLVNVCCLFLGLLHGVFSTMFWACIVILWTVLCPLLSLEIFFWLETSFCPVIIFPLLSIQHNTQNVTLLFLLNKISCMAASPCHEISAGDSSIDIGNLQSGNFSAQKHHQKGKTRRLRKLNNILLKLPG